jgi:hypothetical protein
VDLAHPPQDHRVGMDSFPKHPFTIDIKLYILKVSVFDVVASMYESSVISNTI